MTSCSDTKETEGGLGRRGKRLTTNEVLSGG